MWFILLFNVNVHDRTNVRKPECQGICTTVLREFLFSYMSKNNLCFIYGRNLSKTRDSVLLFLHCTKPKERIKRIIIIIIINLPLPVLLCYAQALRSETSYCYCYCLERVCPVTDCRVSALALLVLHYSCTVLCDALYTACVDASRMVFWDRSVLL